MTASNNDISKAIILTEFSELFGPRILQAVIKLRSGNVKSHFNEFDTNHDDFDEIYTKLQIESLSSTLMSHGLSAANITDPSIPNDYHIRMRHPNPEISFDIDITTFYFLDIHARGFIRVFAIIAFLEPQRSDETFIESWAASDNFLTEMKRKNHKIFIKHVASRILGLFFTQRVIHGSYPCARNILSPPLFDYICMSLDLVDGLKSEMNRMKNEISESDIMIHLLNLCTWLDVVGRRSLNLSDQEFQYNFMDPVETVPKLILNLSCYSSLENCDAVGLDNLCPGWKDCFLTHIKRDFDVFNEKQNLFEKWFKSNDKASSIVVFVLQGGQLRLEGTEQQEIKDFGNCLIKLVSQRWNCISRESRIFLKLPSFETNVPWKSGTAFLVFPLVKSLACSESVGADWLSLCEFEFQRLHEQISWYLYTVGGAVEGQDKHFCGKDGDDERHRQDYDLQERHGDYAFRMDESILASTNETYRDTTSSSPISCFSFDEETSACDDLRPMMKSISADFVDFAKGQPMPGSSFSVTDEDFDDLESYQYGVMKSLFYNREAWLTIFKKPPVGDEDLKIVFNSKNVQ